MAPENDYTETEYQVQIDSRIKYIQDQVEEIRRIARETSNNKKIKQKERYDLTVQLKKKYEIGEQVLMKDQYPDNKFADRWIGPMTVKKINESGSYHLIGPKSRRLNGAVNSDQLVPYHRKNVMIPDKDRTINEQLFKSWIERRSARAE